MRILLAGATGAVGGHVLRLALADARVGVVVAPTRRPLTAHPKLVNPMPDFDALPEQADWLAVDAVICALGTTIKAAGSQAAFAAVDRDLPIALAARAKRCGARVFALNSSLGASHKGSFYQRTKAEAEDGIRAVGFDRFVIVRPGLLDTERATPRPLEKVALVISRALAPLLPARYRPVAADAVARCLLEQAMMPGSGDLIVESDDIR
ncbi:NAD(P)H-binding protein [Massilia sp. R798]|uniref:NAD(P)H-binding protein n=1 Tax=Massilia soli TaxID=2792854 RepID=A0ABS7SUK3_9BURK|nr:NAD(P)H-binding protein [Massilia soli]